LDQNQDIISANTFSTEMDEMQSHDFLFLHFSHFSSKTKVRTFVPIGLHLPGCIGFLGENKPIARMPANPAICNGPVEQATKFFTFEINTINSGKDN
jgi:hypothetical protein